MIIGIDGNEANVPKRVGIGEYSFELLKKFKEFQISNFKFQIYLKNEPFPDMPEESENWKYVVFGPKKLWTQFALPLYLRAKKSRPDVFFSPSHYAPRFSPVPTAISVMDLSYMHFPQLFKKKDLYQLSHWTKYSVKNARAIFTISHASKDDIIKYYSVPAEKVIVTYPGVKGISRPKDDGPLAQNTQNMSNFKSIINKYSISDNFILFVGTLQPRKNISRLIEAFSILNDKGLMIKNLQLVIVGKKGWLFEEIFNAPKKFKVEDSVKFLDFVDEKDLPALYKNARCFVLPSLYEGFGLPILEAMRYGCPVITSNISSLPEVGGDAALYIDPLNTSDIAEKIISVLQNKKLSEEMREKGYKNIKRFSWEKTAKETLQVLQKITTS